jgi:hypothetical protein
MHNSNKMVACTFCKIKGYKHISSRKEWIFGTSMKERDPSVMIKKSKVKISVLVMQRHNQMGTGADGSKKH